MKMFFSSVLWIGGLVILFWSFPHSWILLGIIITIIGFDLLKEKYDDNKKSN